MYTTDYIANITDGIKITNGRLEIGATLLDNVYEEFNAYYPDGTTKKITKLRYLADLLDLADRASPSKG